MKLSRRESFRSFKDLSCSFFPAQHLLWRSCLRRRSVPVNMCKWDIIECWLQVQNVGKQRSQIEVPQSEISFYSLYNKKWISTYMNLRNSIFLYQHESVLEPLDHRSCSFHGSSPAFEGDTMTDGKLDNSPAAPLGGGAVRSTDPLQTIEGLVYHFYKSNHGELLESCWLQRGFKPYLKLVITLDYRSLTYITSFRFTGTCLLIWAPYYRDLRLDHHNFIDTLDLKQMSAPPLWSWSCPWDTKSFDFLFRAPTTWPYKFLQCLRIHRPSFVAFEINFDS